MVVWYRAGARLLSDHISTLSDSNGNLADSYLVINFISRYPDAPRILNIRRRRSDQRRYDNSSTTPGDAAALVDELNGDTSG